MFVDASGNVLAHMLENADRAGKISLPYIEQAPGRVIKTQCVADLRDIFEKGSGLAENYAVTLESTGELSTLQSFPAADGDEFYSGTKG